MDNVARHSEAGRAYAAAYAAHYESKDLHGALELYKLIIDCHPNSQEAAYSRAQVRNIVISVVPEQELFDAQVELATSRLEPVPTAPSDEE
jgi:hypothetical protein